MKVTAFSTHNWPAVLGSVHVTADLIIRANGGLSSVRSYVTVAQAAHTGTFLVQGEVLEPARRCPRFYQLCGSNILLYASQGRLLIAHPNNNGALTYNVSASGLIKSAW